MNQTAAIRTLPDAQTVTSVRHWTDRLFSFRVSRPASLRFRSGEFVMIGLMGDTGKPLLRAYSIASPAWDEELEFYSIKVPEGPLTSRLQHIKPGDEIILRPKPVGTLVHDALLPGKPFIAGARFTITDIILYCALDFGASVGQPRNPALQHLGAWFDRVAARPAAEGSLHALAAATGMRG